MSTVLLQAVASGLATGCVYALIAVGLTIVFGVMRIVNFAHGDFLMLAMFAGYFSWALLGLDPLLAVLLVTALMALLGLGFFEVIIRPALKVPELSQVAVTLGVSLLLQNGMLVAFSSDNRLIANERATDSLQLGPVILQTPLLLAAGASLLLMALIYLVLKKTDVGIQMRAVSQSREGAMLSGIDLTNVFRLSLCAGIAMLGVAGPLMASVLYTNPTVGAIFTLKAFVVVIAGGMGSFGGVLAGALLVGLAESIAAIWLQASLAAAVPFLILVLVLLFRPQGLVATGGGR